MKGKYMSIKGATLSRIGVALLFVITVTTFGCNTSPVSDDFADLKVWLERSETMQNEANLKSLDSTKFANFSLSKEEAVRAEEIIVEHYRSEARKRLKSGWDSKEFSNDGYTMKFDYKVFGDKPATGRSLYISMHGGGSTTAKFNDGQWNNQKKLYTPKEGVYLAPRATTDSWNMWHQGNNDPLFNMIIEAATLFEDVDINRVYLMGYSAGGDGVYQLAPRMAYRLAAAAMMAGHPNETTPHSLYNLPFAIYMGENDAAFKRNEIAPKWDKWLDEFADKFGGGYIHDLYMAKGTGHWMNREDTIAVPWMAQYRREPFPKKIVWKQDDVHHTNFYWLEANSEAIETGGVVVASRSSNHFTISESYTDSISINLNDDMADLDKKITITYGGKDIEFEPKRTITNIYRSITAEGDYSSIYSVSLPLN